MKKNKVTVMDIISACAKDGPLEEGMAKLIEEFLKRIKDIDDKIKKENTKNY